MCCGLWSLCSSSSGGGICCLDNEGDNDDDSQLNAYGLGFSVGSQEQQQVEVRCWPTFDGDGYQLDRDGRVIYLCKYVPWRLSRCFTQLGFDCGLSLSTSGLPGWILGTRPGRRCFFMTILIFLVLLLAWTSYRRGQHTQAILSSPCYVCNPEYSDMGEWWIEFPAAAASATTNKNKKTKKQVKAHRTTAKASLQHAAVKAMNQYAAYAHGVGCALDDGWVRALDNQMMLTWKQRFQACKPRSTTFNIEKQRITGNQTITITPSPSPPPSLLKQQQQQQQQRQQLDCDQASVVERNPWWRYDQLLSGLGSGVSVDSSTTVFDNRSPGQADWRNTLPRIYIVGFRGAGTTSLSHYLDAHPDTAVRRHRDEPDHSNGDHRAKYGPSTKTVHTATPWDDHFFASVPDWSPAELRGWVRRGWGAASLRDHRGNGRLRIEVGPDYLWLASTGAAAAIHRARLPEEASSHYPRFVVLLADPVQLIEEAHARAVDAGIESRTNLSTIVAHELPALAQCLWWDNADAPEQRQRILSGLCGGSGGGGGGMSRIGPPYLWRGLLSVFLAHWMRQATPGGRRRWFFVRSQDLLMQPNRTLNRLGVNFMGLAPFDYGPHVRRMWHPSPESSKVLAPAAPWHQSWKAYVPRLEYIKRARKRTTDALLDAVGRAAYKVLPGLETALKTHKKLKRLHCRLAGLLEPDTAPTAAYHDCIIEDDNGGHGGDNSDEKSKDATTTTIVDRELLAKVALRDFFEPYQNQLMDMVEAVEQLRQEDAAAYHHHRQDTFSSSSPSSPMDSVVEQTNRDNGKHQNDNGQNKALCDFYLQKA